MKSALRLLADSGFGGERSRGWGRAAEPEFSDASSLFAGEGHPGAWWMLSLYSPHADDAVDWSRGDYATATRAGWTDSAGGFGQEEACAHDRRRLGADGAGVARARGGCGAGRLSASGLARRIRAGGARAARGGSVKYRVTVLTPTLVGNGDKLSPIDYMVWRDQVNVLDQPRIFKLLSKGPRLEGYLAQLHKATKLDFASWGGFAQNYADRRIPFEDAAYTPYWERAQAESLSIPTFAATDEGPFLPGAAIKGALRTAFVFANLKPAAIREVAAKLTGERPSRRPAEQIEQQTAGSGGSDRMRVVSVADSAHGSRDAYRVYMLRLATLVARGRSSTRWAGSRPAAARWMASVPKTERRRSRKWPRRGRRSKGLARERVSESRGSAAGRCAGARR